jgi:hypothetical protein
MVELGDFSRALTERWAGVLFQQGRVTMDTDGNAQTMITVDWQDTAAADVIGTGVAAIPAGERLSFLVETAKVVGEGAELTLEPGRAWVNGRLVRIDGNQAVTRLATYLGSPFRAETPTSDSVNAGVRDAVLLEVWREAVSGFQEPDELIEPALGGPDTTERLSTAFDLRLLRLDEGETCESIRDRLIDDRGTRGHLTVSLDEDKTIVGDCPIVEGGGYSGFEHSLFRIEIAATDDGIPRFKWSQFNGGLVGRATFYAPTKRAQITANLTAITSSGLDSFYLEALKFDAGLGRWTVVYGAKVTLDDEHQLVLPTAAADTYLGSIPGDETLFIRLWNGIEQIDGYPAATGGAPFRDGIHLAFDAPGIARRYGAGDYWTFPLRAGDIPNDGPLPTDAPPDGPVIERVPIAVLNWTAELNIDARTGTIEDCRRIFNPLTRLGTCCSYRVGDGLNSYGEFESIQDAIDHLPAEGGEICVLPGTYRENVRLIMRPNVTISGCTGRSIIIGTAPEEGEPDPVIHIVNARGIRITGLAVRAQRDQVGILVEDNVAEILDRGRDVAPTGATRDITLDDLLVNASTRPGIEVHAAQDVVIRNDVLLMDDVQTTWPAIFFQGEDSLIERNVVRVQRRAPINRLPFGNLGRLFALQPPPIMSVALVKQPDTAGTQPAGTATTSMTHLAMTASHVVAGGTPAGAAAGAAAAGAAAAAGTPLTLAPALATPMSFLPGSLEALFTAPGQSARLGLGGIQIAGLSERVRVVGNLVQGGAGNGITLGSIRLVNREGIDLRLRIGWWIDFDLVDDGSPCLPGRVIVVDPPADSPPTTPIPVPAGPLREITIEGNRILDAGLNGIGVVGFFSTENPWGYRRVISVEDLRIDDNEIRGCLTRPVAPTGEAAVHISGFGGISLADVDGLAIRKNVIEDNGADYLDPICGIFLLNGEGVEIADNRVVNNGAPTREPPASARPGRRGGIHIVSCSAPIDLPLPTLAAVLLRGRQNGTPALRVRDNIVSAPLGQALVATANGPVSVHGNAFASLGIVPRPEPLRHGLFGAAVTIVNLGRSAEERSTQKTYAKAAFSAAGFGEKVNLDPKIFELDASIKTEGVEVNALAPGFIQFNDNQCSFAGSLLRPPYLIGFIPIDLAKAIGLAGVKLAGAEDTGTPASGSGAAGGGAAGGGAAAAGGAAAGGAAAGGGASAGGGGGTIAGGGIAAVGGGPVSVSYAATAGTAGGGAAAMAGGGVAGMTVSPSVDEALGAKAFLDYSKAFVDFPSADAVPLEIVNTLDKIAYKPLSPDHPDIVKPEINPGALLPLDLTLRLSSVSLWSLDDIGIHDNQCLTIIPEGTLLTQLFTFGDSVRATGNRFKEGESDAIFSAITLGTINVTAHNEATHCLVVRPKAVPGENRVIDGPNIVTVTGPQRAKCQAFETSFGDFGRLGG